MSHELDIACEQRDELVAAMTKAAAELRHAWKGSQPEWSNEACNWRRFDANLVSRAIRILEEAVTEHGKC